MIYTLDTYAWIEYFEGSPSGDRIKKIIESGDEILFTPSIVLAELSDAVVKGKVKVNWLDVIKFVSINTKIKEIDTEIAGKSGELKNSLRKKHTDFGFIDAIVLATSIKTNSKLLTGDPHLIGEGNVIDIRKDFQL